MHIANGMFGAVIVDPPGYQPAGTEYVLIQNEWYNPAGGLDAVLNGQPTAVALNGVAAQYVSQPLTARAGETVRFYFVNAGVSNFAGFHVIGEIFDHVYPDGNPKNSKQGVQTVTVPPGGAVVADLVAEPGSYPILTHSLGDATQGALGILQVHATDGVTVLYDGQVLTHSAREMDGKTYVSAAEFARLAGVDYEYDAASGRLTVAGKALPADAVMPDGHGGAPYAWIRSLADAVGAKVEWNSATRTVVVTPTGE
jgi:FtsP/CotA-like multicopper oxidase with cupredoxin domain